MQTVPKFTNESLNNRSIIIFANYRTGSTALGDYLSRAYKLRDYSEFFAHSTSNKRLSDLMLPCTLKVMPDHIIPEEFADFINSSYKIGLTRKSLVHQIVSFYIAGETQRYQYNDNDATQDDSYYVDENLGKLGYVANRMLDLCKMHSANNVKMDIEVYYEDLWRFLPYSKYKPTARPSNYRALVTHTERILQLLNRVE